MIADSSRTGLLWHLFRLHIVVRLQSSKLADGTVAAILPPDQLGNNCRGWVEQYPRYVAPLQGSIGHVQAIDIRRDDPNGKYGKIPNDVIWLQ